LLTEIYRTQKLGAAESLFNKKLDLKIHFCNFCSSFSLLCSAAMANLNQPEGKMRKFSKGFIDFFPESLEEPH
jgi:hypothetical protein